MRETRQREFKERVSNSFLKTVSAYANFDGGTVLFGVNDAGEAVGLDDPVATCLNVENMINDALSPRPDYRLSVHEADKTVELVVHGGTFKPYLCKGRAYKRSDSSTVEVDATELKRLVLEGENRTYEQLPSRNQELSFQRLGSSLKEVLELDSFNRDTLKTLGLYTDALGYNNAAAILSDEGGFPGIDIAQFGESIDVMLQRSKPGNASVLDEFDRALRMFASAYCYEEIVGAVRKRVETVPLKAFREALANAIIHRTWDTSECIRVLMFKDRIEVVSPGGLPSGISNEEYLSGTVSVQRNPILAGVFFRLGIVEAFGTGVRRIKEAYVGSATSPRFDAAENSIMVTLPLLKAAHNLTPDQELVYGLLSQVRAKASSEICEDVPFSRSKLNAVLKTLVALDMVERVGAGRGLKYRRK